MRKPRNVNSVFRLIVLKCPLPREGTFLKEKRMFIELAIAAYAASYFIPEQEEEEYEEYEFDDAD